MALTGIGGNGAGGGSPLDKFQKLRDSAQKKLESADRQGGLAELIQRKQKQLGGGASSPDAARSSAERIPPGPGLKQASAASIFGAAADAAAKAGQAAAPSAAYGRSGATSRQDAAPRLGQYVDFRA
jgi:predicted ATPase